MDVSSIGLGREGMILSHKIEHLKDRIHDCPHCGLKLDRDLNASLNILQRGIQKFKELGKSSVPKSGLDIVNLDTGVSSI